MPPTVPFVGSGTRGLPGHPPSAWAWVKRAYPPTGPILIVRGKYAVIPRQAHPPHRHQRRKVHFAVLFVLPG